MRFVYHWAAKWLILILSTLSPWHPIHTELGEREQIGEVLGTPVYRDEIRKGQSRIDELKRLFLAPVMIKYRLEHLAEVTPSTAEIEAAQKIFEQQQADEMQEEGPTLREELQAVESKLAREDLPEDERSELEVRKSSIVTKLKLPDGFAEFVLTNWKFQKHLYDKFGGGRLLWQQRGMEAIDAMRTLIETREKEGAFTITDPELRDRFFSEWTALESNPFVVKDPERIRTEFLEPEWAPVASK